jgi:outer membrane protein OmpA-like peptidoglycan-associated protein
MAVFTPGISPYAYANDDPISNYDEDGLGIRRWWEKARDIALTAVGFTRVGSLKAIGTNGKSNVYYRWDHGGKSGSRRGSSSGTATAHTPYVPATSSSIPLILSDEPDQPEPIIISPIPIEEPIPKYKDKPIKGGTYLPFAEDVHFVGSSDRFYDAAYTEKTLSDLVKTLQESPQLTVLILGNVDINTHTMGNSAAALQQQVKYNGQWKPASDLMVGRARAVFNYLVRKGIDPVRLIYGSGNVLDTPDNSGMKTTFILKNP